MIKFAEQHLTRVVEQDIYSAANSQNCNLYVKKKQFHLAGYVTESLSYDIIIDVTFNWVIELILYDLIINADTHIAKLSFKIKATYRFGSNDFGSVNT